MSDKTQKEPQGNNMEHLNSKRRTNPQNKPVYSMIPNLNQLSMDVDDDFLEEEHMGIANSSVLSNGDKYENLSQFTLESILNSYIEEPPDAFEFNEDEDDLSPPQRIQ